MNNTRVASIIYAATVALLFAVPNLAIAQEAADGGGGGLNYSLIDLIKFGGWVGYIIILLSVAAVALVIEYAISIRPKVLIPEVDIEELETKIKAGSYDEIVALCCDAWNNLIDRPWKIMPIGMRDWAHQC